MRMMVLLCTMLMAAAGVLSPWVTAGEDAAAGAPEPRVVLRINRNLEVSGHVKLEDDDVIVVRTLKGEIESFAKSRILQIVRLVDPQPGQRGAVVMRDGQVRQGVVLEDSFEQVIVEIEGVRTKLPRDQVSHVVLQRSVEEQYRDFKAAISPGMHDTHLSLCRWLVEQRRYDLARTELLELLEVADMAEGRELLKIVEAQLALQTKPANAASKPGKIKSGASESDSLGAADSELAAEAMLPTEIITREDVNMIRVYELDFEHPVKVIIAPATVRELIEKYSASNLIPTSQAGRNAMYRAASEKPLEIVRLMFELRARDLYPQVQVNTEPYALNLFRQRVHDTWLMNNCASNQCHGGIDAGGFFLHRRNYKDERVRYTNLLILERLQLDPEWPLINYEKPEESLIVQYGLPRDLARKPHPHVQGWRPAFTQTNQRMLESTLGWIRAMMSPRPDYPVDYEPPMLKPSVPAGEEGVDQKRPPR